MPGTPSTRPQLPLSICAQSECCYNSGRTNWLGIRNKEREGRQGNRNNAHQTRTKQPKSRKKNKSAICRLLISNRDNRGDLFLSGLLKFKKCQKQQVYRWLGQGVWGTLDIVDFLLSSLRVSQSCWNTEITQRKTGGTHQRRRAPEF